MNPLSPFTYCRRHKRHAALLFSLSIIVTIGLYSMGALVWGVFVEPVRSAYMAFTNFSMVTPVSDDTGPDPAVLTRIRANPDVARVIPTTFIRIELPSMMSGEGYPFDLHGLMEKDLLYVLTRCGADLKEGQLPEPGTNGLLLSNDVAAILDVKVGDTYDAISSEFYASVDASLEPTPFEVVGILDSEVELGIVSLEFLDSHELYGDYPARFLVVAQENREAAVDDFLRTEIQTPWTDVMTLKMLNERIVSEALPGFVLLAPPMVIVTLAFSLVTVVVNRIANARRLPEFGILNATGRSRNWLVRRLTMETTMLALVGWAMGIGIGSLFLHLLKVTVFASQGHDLDYIAWIPIVLTLPIPTTIAGFTFASVRRTLSRLDPVTVVERGELGQEGERNRQRPVSKSSPKPLAPPTFYRRHRRRVVLLVGGMALTISSVVLLIFALSVAADAQEPFLGYLSRISIVRSPGTVQSLDPGMVTRVENHAAVERVIPVAPRSHMFGLYIPPFTGAEASPFGVYAEDMAYLVELYGLELKEGRLPRPGTNEMVIPETLAKNRSLEVGDVIGDPFRPAYPGASSLPAKFVISGIFFRPSAPENGDGLGFISFEFLEDHEPFPIPEVPPLIVVPKPGQKDTLDDWLENELAGTDASVLTYRRELSRVRGKAQQDMMGVALLEVVIAIVAAVGLAVLSYIFVSQRQAEFGVLHALGYSRLRLVGRVLGEMAFTTGTAWFVSAIIGLVGLLYLRFGVFAPLGLSFDLIDVTPWLYTVPIPLLVLAVTGGTIVRALSKLDPVSIIERR